MRAGASLEELGERLKQRLPAELDALKYPFIAHGAGLADEYPCVKWDNHHPGVLEPGMVMSVECYAGARGCRRGREARRASPDHRVRAGDPVGGAV